MDEVTLYKEFAAKMKDYIERHNGNYTLIESTLNSLVSLVVGASGGLSVPLGLQTIFDRRGLIGIGSYDFNEGVLAGPSYNLSVAAGAYWYVPTFYSKDTVTLLAMSGRTTGTYYVGVDSTGFPIIQTSPTSLTIRQFAWDSVTHTVSAKALYTGVAVLFDGDDYADQLTSAARSKSFTKVADRLEEIEGMLAEMGGYYTLDHADGLDLYYKAGICRDADSQIHATVAGSVTCTNSVTNYIEIDPADGSVVVNQVAFTSGKIPLFKAVATAGELTITDERTWACLGGGGGGGSHAQNTDTGTSASEFELDSDASGSPTGKVGLKVNNGDDPDAYLKFDRDTGKWVYSQDGGATFIPLGELTLDPGAQELTKYVALEDPPLVFEDLDRGESADYEDLEFGPYITASLGVAAVILRIAFWDTENDAKCLFKKKGSIYSPTDAFTINNQNVGRYGPYGIRNGSVLVLPLDDDLKAQFFILLAGTDTANLRVFLMGYLEKVTGVGTQAKEFTRADLNVGAGATQDFNLTGFLNRGLCHYLEVEQTGACATTYDVEIYTKDSFGADYLAYQATGIDPAVLFADPLPFWVADDDGSHELHLRIINHDGANAGVFNLTMRCEQFA